MMYYYGVAFYWHLIWLLALRQVIALHLQLNGYIWDFTIMPRDQFIIFKDLAADYSQEKTHMEMTLRGRLMV